MVSTVEGMGLGFLGGEALDFSSVDVLGSMAVGGLAGLGLSWALSLRRQVPGALGTMMVNGAVYGLLTSYIVWDECDPCNNLSGALFIGSAAGTLLGAGSTLLLHLTSGAAGAMSFGEYTGIWGTLLVLYATEDEVTANARGLGTLTGATLGLVAGPFLDRWLHVDRDRWLTITAWSLVGSLLALGVAGFAHPSLKTAALLSLAGGVIGGGLGAAVTIRDEPPSTSPPVMPPAPIREHRPASPPTGILLTLAEGVF